MEVLLKLKTINDLIAWQLSSRTVTLKLIYADLFKSYNKDGKLIKNADIVAGLLLSQIMYWFMPGENGKSKLRVERNGRFWLCKSRKEWHNEIRISSRQYDRVAKILGPRTKYNPQGLNIIDIETFKFGGTPKTHIAINFDVLMNLLNIELSKYSTHTNTFITKKSKIPNVEVKDKDAVWVESYLAKQSEKYRETWQYFLDHRRNLKSPMTKHAKYLMLFKLDKVFPCNSEEHITRFNNSITNGWKGVLFANELKKLNDRLGEGF